MIQMLLTAWAALYLTAAPGQPLGPQTNLSLAPPPRPLAITANQAVALEQLASQPEHQSAQLARASYSPEAARQMVELGVAATQISIPGAILAVLIAAAPL